MTSAETDPLRGAVKAAWRRFVDECEPHRPELYRYCRHLTRSPWDAEDLVQEVMARAFVMLGVSEGAAPPNMRAWLFRVASNAWLNRVRQPREVLTDGDAPLPEPSASSELRATREAAGTVLSQLAPRERAAVVLKDAFGLTLEEIAQALSSTTGAIKAALHRGRSKLLEPEPHRQVPVAPPVLDAFCEAFNNRDLDRLTGLLLADATLEYPGFKVEVGAATIRSNSLMGTLMGCPEIGFVITEPPRCEVRAHRGESFFLWWSGAAVHAVVRVEVVGDCIARLVTYYHSPEVVSELCRELDVPYRTHGYGPTSSSPSTEVHA